MDLDTTANTLTTSSTTNIKATKEQRKCVLFTLRHFEKIRILLEINFVRCNVKIEGMGE